MNNYIFGIHEKGGEDYMIDAGKSGWILFTEGIGDDPNDFSSVDYSEYSQKGLKVIVRLNYGYNPDGTIPRDYRYRQFSTRITNFIRSSKGCTNWIIGNEMNHEVEWPNGVPITPLMYALCFRQCYTKISKLAEKHNLIIGAVAPWNNQTKYAGNENGDWIVYFVDVLKNVICDGIAIHTYTHGSDPQLLYSEARMNPPFQNRRYEFRTYMDFMTAIPFKYRDLPVYITETDQDQAWLDSNNGWIQEAYNQINAWNSRTENQQIHSLILYRWPKIDKWYIEGKQGVIDQFKEALQHEYVWNESKTPFQKGQLVTTDYYINVRSQTGVGNVPIALAIPRTTLNIIDGPVFDSFTDWYKVGGIGYNGQPFVGWVAEYTSGDIKLLINVDDFRISAPYGAVQSISQLFAENPQNYAAFSYEGVQLRGHNGIDFSTTTGTTIKAVDSGFVKAVSTQDNGGFGIYVLLEHKWGESIYAHLSSLYTNTGIYVNVGDIIGSSGNTGNSTGPHLHFGIRKKPFAYNDGWGGYCDPLPYLPRGSFRLPSYVKDS